MSEHPRFDPKKRSSNWTSDEELVVVEETKKKEDTLFGKMKGSGTQKVSVLRSQAWQDIANKLNALFTSKKRSPEEVKKKYYNIKQRGKEKYDLQKRPKTGGGPAVNMSASEEAVINDMLASSKSQLCGVDSGLDTDAPSTSSMTMMTGMSSWTETVLPIKDVSDKLTLAAINDEDSPVYNAVPLDLIDSTPIMPMEGLKRKMANTNSTNKKMKTVRIESLEEKNFHLDNQRLELEIEKLKLCNVNLKIEREIMLLKKQEMEFRLQAQYPQFIDMVLSKNES